MTAEELRAALACGNNGCGCIRPGPTGLTHCPAHSDRTPSLSVTEAENGKPLWNCKAGCGQSAVLEALRDRGLWKQVSRSTPAASGLTLEQFAEAKGLRVDFLQSRGIRQGSYHSCPCVVFPYADVSGEVRSERKRLSLSIEPRFKSGKGDRPMPYGLGSLSEGRKAGYIHLVEGESDCLTFWQSEMPALGIPGVNTWRSEWAKHLSGIETVYLWHEADAGGDSLLAKIIKDIPQAKIIELSAKGAKDASALWLMLGRDSDEFYRAVDHLMQAARPAQTVKSESLSREARELWSKCEHLAVDPNLLDRVGEAVTATGYAGDVTVPKTVYMEITSRFRPEPINLQLFGPSAVGKTEAVNAGRRLHPLDACHDAAAGSARALVYDHDADYQHKTVIVPEADSLPEDGPAASAVRALATENVMRYDVVLYDEEAGQYTTHHIEKPGPTGLITTSTKPLGEQMGTRVLVVSVSDSADQTRDIMRAQASRAASTDDEAVDLEPFHALQKWLEIAGVHDVVIPFAPALAELIPNAMVRMRRDFPQLLSMISAIALLYQCQRKKNVAGRIVATLDDYAQARNLLLDVFSETATGGVSRAVRDTVRAVEELHNGAPVEVKALSKYMNLHRSTAYRRVNRAVELGYLTNDETRRNQPAKLRLGDPLPEDRPALPTVKEVEEQLEQAEKKQTYLPETDATVQPPGDSPIYVVSEEPAATEEPVVQPEMPVQQEVQPANESISDTNEGEMAGAVARLHPNPGDMPLRKVERDTDVSSAQETAPCLCGAPSEYKDSDGIWKCETCAVFTTPAYRDAPTVRPSPNGFDRDESVAYILASAARNGYPLISELRIGPGQQAHERRLDHMDDEEVQNARRWFEKEDGRCAES